VERPVNHDIEEDPYDGNHIHPGPLAPPLQPPPVEVVNTVETPPTSRPLGAPPRGWDDVASEYVHYIPHSILGAVSAKAASYAYDRARTSVAGFVGGFGTPEDNDAARFFGRASEMLYIP
jgi:hypothetical protein